MLNSETSRVPSLIPRLIHMSIQVSHTRARPCREAALRAYGQWAVVDKQRRDGRRLTVHKHLVHSMEDAMYQVECGANGDAEDLVECRRLMNDAAKKVRQIAAAKAIAKANPSAPLTAIAEAAWRGVPALMDR